MFNTWPQVIVSFTLVILGAGGVHWYTGETRKQQEAVDQIALNHCAYDFQGYRLKIKNSITRDTLIRDDFNDCLKTKLGDGYVDSAQVKGEKCFTLSHTVNNSLVRDIASSVGEYDKIYDNMRKCGELK